MGSQAENTKKVLFRDHVYDNIFWSCGSGVATWTLCGTFDLCLPPLSSPFPPPFRVVVFGFV